MQVPPIPTSARLTAQSPRVKPITGSTCLGARGRRTQSLSHSASPLLGNISTLAKLGRRHEAFKGKDILNASEEGCRRERGWLESSGNEDLIVGQG